MKLERTNSILEILKQAENRLHVLKNSWPSGIRSLDDETDKKIKDLIVFIKNLREKIGA